MEQANLDQYFIAVLREQELRGMLGLGKIADPSTGEANPNLEMTRYAIGVLEALEAKTKGNLSDVEKQELRRVLTTLRINFVEEVKKAPAQKESAAAPEGESPAGGAAGDETAAGTEGAGGGQADPGTEAEDAPAEKQEG